MLRAARMADPPREQVNSPRLSQPPMDLRPRRALCPPRFASRAPNPDSCLPRLQEAILAGAPRGGPPAVANRAQARPSRLMHGSVWQRSRRAAWPVRLRLSAVARTKSCTLCRVRAGRSFGSEAVAKTGARGSCCVMKPSIASTGWVVCGRRAVQERLCHAPRGPCMSMCAVITSAEFSDVM